MDDRHAGPYFVGIDGGSQSSKVVVLDAEGRVVCAATETLAPMHTPRPGVVEHPGDDLYDTILTATRRAMAAFPHPVDQILGVGLCTIRCCRALVRADGTLAQPVQSWMDDRLSRPYEHTDDDVAYVTTTSGYLMGRLTRSRTDTAANYIGPWPMDVRTWDWYDDQDTFDSFGVPREMLYELQLPGDVGGHVSADFAAATGLPPGLPVVHTANDKATEALGSGLRDQRLGLLSLGTYIAGMVVGEEFVAEPQTFFTNFASEPHRYLYESAGIRRGMWTVSWLVDLLGPQVSRGSLRPGQSPVEDLNELATVVPAGSDGLLCVLDWLSPPSEPHRKGMFVGFDERHGAGHLYRSVLEGIAFGMRHHVGAMEAELGVRLERLVVSGGGAESDVAMQVLADVFDLPVTRNRVRSAAGLGAAMGVAVACGVYPDLDVATERMVHKADEFTPDPGNALVYARLLEVHVDLAAATDDVLRRTYDALHD